MENKFLRPSYIELDRRALLNNLVFLKKQGKQNLKYSSVIKGNAYGHGISSFLPMAEECGIDHFSVFSADEAFAALKFKTRESTGVMIMGMIRDEELKWAAENGVEVYLFEMERLRAAISAATETGKKVKIHLQIETGMNRTGFEEEEWEEVFNLVKNSSDKLELTGICTHYAGAESVANYYRIQNQDTVFKKALSTGQEHLRGDASDSRLEFGRIFNVSRNALRYGAPGHRTVWFLAQPRNLYAYFKTEQVVCRRSADPRVELEK